MTDPLDFIRYLQFLGEADTGEKRKALAELRRGLPNPARAPVMAPYVEKYTLGEQKWPRFCYYAIAALFALHGKSCREGNLGHHLRRLPHRGVESDLLRVLQVPRSQIYPHVTRLMRQLKANDIPVNWLRLLRDLIGWGHPSRYVQTAWRKGFYTPLAEEEPNIDPTSNQPTERKPEHV